MEEGTVYYVWTIFLSIHNLLHFVIAIVIWHYSQPNYELRNNLVSTVTIFLQDKQVIHSGKTPTNCG